MTVKSVFAIPEARHWLESSDDPERVFVLGQMKEARARVIEDRQLTADEFDSLIRKIEAEPAVERFRFNARIVVMGQRPS